MAFPLGSSGTQRQALIGSSTLSVKQAANGFSGADELCMSISLANHGAAVAYFYEWLDFIHIFFSHHCQDVFVKGPAAVEIYCTEGTPRLLEQRQPQADSAWSLMIHDYTERTNCTLNCAIGFDTLYLTEHIIIS